MPSGPIDQNREVFIFLVNCIKVALTMVLMEGVVKVKINFKIIIKKN